MSSCTWSKLEQGHSVLREPISKEELLWWNSVAAYDTEVIRATNKSSKLFLLIIFTPNHFSNPVTSPSTPSKPSAPSTAVLAWMKGQEKVAGGRKVFLKIRFSMLSMPILPILCCWSLLSKALGAHPASLPCTFPVLCYTGWTSQKADCSKFRFSLTGWELLTWNPAACLTFTGLSLHEQHFQQCHHIYRSEFNLIL